MLILAVESTAKTVSVALVKVLDGENQIIAETFINTKQTHSETLMPALDSMLKKTNISLSDISLIAAANGPGSFTGVRIGISSVKGLAFPTATPCVGISTLEAIAYGGLPYEGKVICAVMDARRNQVYNGMFRIENNVPIRLCEDRAIAIEDLYNELKDNGSNTVLMGDGAKLCFETFKTCGAILAPEQLVFQRASSVAFAAAAKPESAWQTPEKLSPVYLRIPQAERELKKKQGERL